MRLRRLLASVATAALLATVFQLQGTAALAQVECKDSIKVTSHTDVDGGVGQLREALAGVCDGGTIRIQPGRIVLERGRLVIPQWRELKIIGQGGGDEPRVTIDANGSDRILTLEPDSDATLARLRLTGGSVEDGNGGAVEARNATLTVIDSVIEDNAVSSPYRGGGIYNEDGSVTLSDCVVRANSAGYGGGISASGGTTDIVGSSIEANTAASSSGGGIHAYGTLRIVDSTLKGNESAWSGGAVYGSNLTLTDSTVKDNAAIYGGGIYGPRAAIVDSTIKGNAAVLYGGGTYVYRELSISGSVIKDNAVIAGYGGGVYNGSRMGVTTIADSIIKGNSAYQGGGIYSRYSRTTIADAAIQDNFATSVGGGIRFVADESSGTLMIEGLSIIQRNTASNGGGIYWSGPSAPTFDPSVMVTKNDPNDIYPVIP
jgi:hypothetical protein